MFLSYENIFEINVSRLQKGQSKMDNSEKPATQDTQDEDKQNTTQYVLDTMLRNQTYNVNY